MRLNVLFVCWFFGLSLPLFAQLDTKPLIEDVGVDEKLGQRINLAQTFTDRHGNPVTLGDLFTDGKPVIIAPVYYSCPQLCTLVLNGVRNLINDMTLTLGEDYRVVNICIDPDNTPEMAADKAKNYIGTLDRPEPADKNWFFLTGNSQVIENAMDQIGFRYKKVDEQYNHASVIVLVSPQGVISRYVYGVTYPAKDVRLGLVEAAEGKVGTTLDKVLIYCFRYDPLAGKYVKDAMNLMRLGSGLSLLAMLVIGFFLWRSELLNKTEAGT
ncbi:SCO family protein [Acanthopleuribacter pedis]|uniref:SCO family protein n=1 Tax=Acanthopleuribacter pedis TaxID=442870 RepID=A0A8J7QR38_9BACT|nr:SCO family protein [Acanthopleuribacter pedis]MBO1322645.1 SCO family protein [Acanthopleuribacter pedis]